MKNLLLGLCLVGLTFACKSNDNLSVDDAQDPNMPAVECGSECESACCETECSGAKAECAGEQAECSASKAECSASEAECSGAQAECSGDAPAGCSDAKPEGAVCPVTGKPAS
jgi:hypothetical protein